MRLPSHAAACLIGLTCLSAVGCHDPEPQTISAAEVVLNRQLASLRRLLAASADAPVVPTGGVLVTVDEELIQSLVTTALPIEGIVSDRYAIRLESARVTLDDGIALVRLEGRAALSETLADDAFARVMLHADLGVVEIDPRSHILRARVRLIAFEAHELQLFGKKAPGHNLVAELAREQLESLAPLLSSIEIPVRIEHQLELPGIGPAPVRIPPRTLPIVAEVRSVIALRHRLFVTLGVAFGDQEETEP